MAYNHDETMKSFLYFKIMQSIEQNIKTDLKIQFGNETMGFCIAQTDLIRNSTRNPIREKGVVAGTTDKGLGRGNGLIIAEKTIQKYKNVVLNSFFQKDDFVQYLRIEKI